MTTNHPTHGAEDLARRTCEILGGRCIEAVRYAEAYEPGATAHIVIDGTMYSPSTRALPYGAEAWEAGAEVFELWQDIVDHFTDSLEVPEDTDSEAPEPWTFAWEDGCLWAFSPMHGEEA